MLSPHCLIIAMVLVRWWFAPVCQSSAKMFSHQIGGFVSSCEPFYVFFIGFILTTHSTREHYKCLKLVIWAPKMVLQDVVTGLWFAKISRERSPKVQVEYLVPSPRQHSCTSNYQDHPYHWCFWDQPFGCPTLLADPAPLNLCLSLKFKAHVWKMLQDQENLIEAVNEDVVKLKKRFFGSVVKDGC